MLRRQAPRTLVPHYRLFSSRCRRGIEAMLCVTGREEARLDSPSVTAGGAAIKARGYPPIFFENRFPPRPLRGAALRSAALTAAPPPIPRTLFSMVRAQALEVIMSMYESIGTASANVVYRVMKALVAGLELEFGRGAGKRSEERRVGKELSVRVDLGGRSILKKKKAEWLESRKK